MTKTQFDETQAKIVMTCQAIDSDSKLYVTDSKTSL
jgi:hypothetical protein